MYCVLLMIINKGLYGNELLTVNMKIVLEIMVDKYVYVLHIVQVCIRSTICKQLHLSVEECGSG